MAPLRKPWILCVGSRDVSVDPYLLPAITTLLRCLRFFLLLWTLVVVWNLNSLPVPQRSYPLAVHSPVHLASLQLSGLKGPGRPGSGQLQQDQGRWPLQIGHKPTIDLPNRVYCLLWTPQCSRPSVHHSSRDFFAAIGGDLSQSEAICHGFPSQAEARAYFAGASEIYPSTN